MIAESVLPLLTTTSSPTYIQEYQTEQQPEEPSHFTTECRPHTQQTPADKLNDITSRLLSNSVSSSSSIETGSAATALSEQTSQDGKAAQQPDPEQKATSHQTQDLSRPDENETFTNTEQHKCTKQSENKDQTGEENAGVRNTEKSENADDLCQQVTKETATQVAIFFT